MLSDDIKKSKEEINKYNGIYNLTVDQFNIIIDLLLPQIEAQEALIKKMLDIVKSKRSDYINCNQCEVEDIKINKKCEKCIIKKLDDIIQQAKEIIK